MKKDIDNNLISIFAENVKEYYYPTIEATSEHDDALKITGKSRSITVFCPMIIGGKEDCVDINNECFNISVYARYVVRNRVATIKGGSALITISGNIENHADRKWYNFIDFDINGWSDQSKNKAHTIFIHTNPKPDNKKTWVLLWQPCTIYYYRKGTTTTQQPKDVSVIRVPAFIKNIFFFLKTKGIL